MDGVLTNYFWWGFKFELSNCEVFEIIDSDEISKPGDIDPPYNSHQRLLHQIL